MHGLSSHRCCQRLTHQVDHGSPPGVTSSTRSAPCCGRAANGGACPMTARTGKRPLMTDGCGARRGRGSGVTIADATTCGWLRGARPSRVPASLTANACTRRAGAGREALTAPHGSRAGSGLCASRPQASGAPGTCPPPTAGIALRWGGSGPRHPGRWRAPGAPTCGWLRAITATREGVRGSSSTWAGRPRWCGRPLGGP